MIYRITFGFAGGAQGWSETHALKNFDPNPGTLAAAMSQLAQKRANFLGAPFALTAVRIAKFYDELTASRARGVFLIKKSFTAQTPSLVGGAEPADVALIGRGQVDPTDPAIAAFVSQQNQSFFGGPPDAAVDLGGRVDLGQAGLGASASTFIRGMITNNMGWITYARQDDVGIDTITQNPDGTVTFVLERAVNPVPTLNTTYSVRVRAVNQGRSPLVGALTGFFTAATTFATAAPIGISTPQVGGRMRVYSRVPVFLPYLNVALEETTGQHDRGRPFGSPRGRQRKRVRG